MDTLSELIHFIDVEGHERFIHPATIAEAHVYPGEEGQVSQITIVTTAPSTGSQAGGRAHQVIVNGVQAAALARELRRRAGVPDEAEAAEAAPAVQLGAPVQRLPRFLTQR